MRHVKVLIAALSLACCLSAAAQTQETPDYFSGNWSVLIKGTPQGDVKLGLTVEKKDTTLSAVVLDSSGKELAKVDKLVCKDSMMIAYFNAMGYDLYLEMTRKDDDHLVGNCVGMFEAEAERIKSTAEKK